MKVKAHYLICYRLAQSVYSLVRLTINCSPDCIPVLHTRIFSGNSVFEVTFWPDMIVRMMERQS